jgi:hypothetical protein
VTCAICGCHDDDACPEVCAWSEDAPAGVPVCSSCMEMAEALGHVALELARGRQTRRPTRSHSFEIGWSLLTWLTLEDAGPGAVIDRWGASEPWSDQPGGLLEGRKVWERARGLRPRKHVGPIGRLRSDDFATPC